MIHFRTLRNASNFHLCTVLYGGWSASGQPTHRTIDRRRRLEAIFNFIGGNGGLMFVVKSQRTRWINLV